jgi:hypothetical protein
MRQCVTFVDGYSVGDTILSRARYQWYDRKRTGTIQLG